MPPEIVCLISADAEWRTLSRLLQPRLLQPQSQARTPYGGMFVHPFECRSSIQAVRFVQGGWGKIAAAASTQYVLDHFKPDIVLNLGTCGGFAGRIEKGTILLVEQTIVYDIYELMGDPEEHIQHYATRLNLDWLGDAPLPVGYRRGLMLSADRDLMADQLPELQARHGAYAGDWESGAIAWVCQRNAARLLILRGVTDLVGSYGDETYGNPGLFESETGGVFARLLADLPDWLERIARA